ncbi:hypothetical protein Tdes44962_MAKER09621 [Teratosphaeria destructans]|uniref:Ubiquitin-like protease family profile domain-containing protein n=1 Tax=Teratosphaeria destructans TaxID=418781 RepID=A0A9W7SSG8_9PEZI|nr:hypothetical protein Tdes44962_MAKER09621 [Teratosphaeria destructans]
MLLNAVPELPADLREKLHRLNDSAIALPSLDEFESIVDRVRLLPDLEPTWATALFHQRVLDSISWQLGNSAKAGGTKAKVLSDIADVAGSPAQVRADFGDITAKLSIKIRALLREGHSYSHVAAAWRHAWAAVPPGRKGRESRKFPGRVLAAVRKTLLTKQALPLEPRSASPSVSALEQIPPQEHGSGSPLAPSDEQTFLDKRRVTEPSDSIPEPLDLQRVPTSGPSHFSTSLSHSVQSSAPTMEEPRHATASLTTEPDVDILPPWSEDEASSCAGDIDETFGAGQDEGYTVHSLSDRASTPSITRGEGQHRTVMAADVAKRSPPMQAKQASRTASETFLSQRAEISMAGHDRNMRQSFPLPETTTASEDQRRAAITVSNGGRPASVSPEASMPVTPGAVSQHRQNTNLLLPQSTSQHLRQNSTAINTSHSPPDYCLENIAIRRTRRATSAPPEESPAKRRKLSMTLEMASTPDSSASISRSSTQCATPSVSHTPATSPMNGGQPSTVPEERDLSRPAKSPVPDCQRELMIQKLPCLLPGGWLSSDVLPVLLSAFNPTPATIWLPHFITVGSSPTAFHRYKTQRIRSSHAMVLVPLSVDGNHWMLAWFVLQGTTVTKARLFDPYHNVARIRQCQSVLWEFLVFHGANVEHAILAMDDYPFIQRNTNDCGMFVTIRAICLMNRQDCPQRTEGLPFWRYALIVLVQQQYNIPGQRPRPPSMDLLDHSTKDTEITYKYNPQDPQVAIRRIQQAAFQRRETHRQTIRLLKLLAATCQSVHLCISSALSRFAQVRQQYANGIEDLRKLLLDGGFDEATAREAAQNKLDLKTAPLEYALKHTAGVVQQDMQAYNEQAQRLHASVLAQMEEQEALAHQMKVDLTEERLRISGESN